MFDGWCFVHLDSRISNMFVADMRTTLAQRFVSIVWSVSDQTCFNRLATHFNISLFGHQTMFDGDWSANISRLSRPLHSGSSKTNGFLPVQPDFPLFWKSRSSIVNSAPCDRIVQRAYSLNFLVQRNSRTLPRPKTRAFTKKIVSLNMTVQSNDRTYM